MSLLEVENLRVQFNTGKSDGDGKLVMGGRFDTGGRFEMGGNAVDGVSLSVEAGEIVGLIGRSGSGKSTLVRAVTGLLPSNANVVYDRLQWEGGRPKAAMVFQDPLTYLNPGLKIGWQLKETIRRHQDGRARVDEMAADLLEEAGIWREAKVLGKYPFELSGGQRQRIVLAIALACRPKLLIADEPTTALDMTVQRQILTRLRRVAKETGVAVLLVSHDFGVIASMAERVLVMHEGKIVETGTPRQIYEEPRENCTKRLMEYARAMSAGSVGTGKAVSAGSVGIGKVVSAGSVGTGKAIVTENAGRAVVARGVEAGENMARTSSEELLRVEHLCKSYADGKALGVEDVSFTVKAGECFGLAGESGCGKTTLARMLCGLTRPSAGGIYFRGERLAPIGRGGKRIGQIQMVFQDPYASLNPCHTVGWTLAEPLRLSGETSREARGERIVRMLEMVGLAAGDAKKYPSAFSGGQRQRIAIARALLANPRMLVLDEPVSSLDMATRGQILQLFLHMQKERGLSYLFISHDLQAVRQLCPRMGVMYAGRVVEAGNTKEIYGEPWHPYTKMLLQSVLPSNPREARKNRDVFLADGEGMERRQTTGCPFAGRCGYAMDRCRKEKPPMRRFPNREVACFLYSEGHMGKENARAQI